MLRKVICIVSGLLPAKGEAGGEEGEGEGVGVAPPSPSIVGGISPTSLPFRFCGISNRGSHRVAGDEIEMARRVFVWGGLPPA